MKINSLHNTSPEHSQFNSHVNTAYCHTANNETEPHNIHSSMGEFDSSLTNINISKPSLSNTNVPKIYQNSAKKLFMKIRRHRYGYKNMVLNETELRDKIEGIVSSREKRNLDAFSTSEHHHFKFISQRYESMKN